MKNKQLFAAFLALILSVNPILAVGGKEDSKSESGSGAPPQYQIIDIGVVQAGDTASQGFGVSTGGVAVGRSIRNGGAQAYSWTSGGGIVGLPNLAARAFCVSNGANNGGIVVGTCANSLFGTARLPVIWENGAVSQLPLPSGEALGDANDVNASGTAVGSVASGIVQRGVIYSGGNGTIITQTTANGSFFRTAFRINDSGRVVGQGVDPTNAARNVGIVYDIGSSSAFEVGALPSANGALAFDVSKTGFVVGASMLNQGSSRPFIWSQAGGMTEIPLPTGTSSGSARGVNSAGWAVGTASSAFAIPFLYDGTSTYRLQDLIPANSGWDLSMNTSSSAFGISDDNIIVGTGVYNGQTHAYAMIPQTTETAFDFDGDGRTDVSVWRPSDGNWHLSRSTDGYANYSWGASGDKIVPGDFDGDGKADVAVWRPADGSWHILNSDGGTYSTYTWGASGDVPVVGDYDDDGKADVAVYRSADGNWHVRRSSDGGYTNVIWGVAGDVPVARDFDGDGQSDIAVRRPSTGEWFINRSTAGYISVTWGVGTDVAVHADYDGDQKDDVAVWRPSTGEWFILRSSDGGFTQATWGATGDVPVPGDYDGDGRADISVVRNGVWHISQSTDGYRTATWGVGADVAIPGRY